MDPYRNPNLNSHLSPSEGATPVSLPSPPLNAATPPYPFSPSSPVIQTVHSSYTALNYNPPPYRDPYSSTPPPSDPDLHLTPRSWHQPNLAPVPSLRQAPASVPGPGLNPYPAPPSVTPTPPSQVSIVIQSPDLSLSLPSSPSPALCLDDSCPDLECAICFSQFNNVFRCPKMLQCKHTFCLECLARMNVKSAQPNAIQCPLCRSLTPLPDLGLPKLATDSDVLSYLPAAMQRVYSIRFTRSKGKLQVKRSDSQSRWGQRSLTSLRSISHSLDVGLPSPPIGGPRVSRSEAGTVGRVLFRLTGRPACQAFLLMSVVMMMVLLVGIVIFLLTFKNRE
ncbi:uncharacterized protein ACN63O_008115 [Diretmus argenteus]